MGITLKKKDDETKIMKFLNLKKARHFQSVIEFSTTK